MAQMKMDARSRRVYLEGLKKYRDSGVRILLDGRETDASAWNVIFEVQEDGSFYMGDYILENSASQARAEQVCEERTEYGQAELAGKRLKEIRFDKVYNR